eukprot:TRINITY_DN49773_c0_g1_i1.p1 TRINITY_DN49773_c0_g1~~TRINITY_DN49773_c0_g1_i1.p1  ORF type:complete len:576 (+),score=129.96 TRINITY_DN49773_c0_g1_i1:56-1783(+)
MALRLCILCLALGFVHAVRNAAPEVPGNNEEAEVPEAPHIGVPEVLQDELQFEDVSADKGDVEVSEAPQRVEVPEVLQNNESHSPQVPLVDKEEAEEPETRQDVELPDVSNDESQSQAVPEEVDAREEGTDGDGKGAKMEQKWAVLHKSLSQIESYMEVLASAVAREMPAVTVTVGQLAGATGQMTKAIGLKILAEVNMCEEDKRHRVQAAVTTLVSVATQAASFAVKGAVYLGPVAVKTAQSVAKIEALLAKDLASLEESEQVKKILAELLQAAQKVAAERVEGTVPQDVQTAVADIAGFSKQAVELSVRLTRAMGHTLHSEGVQNELTILHELAGELAAAAVTHWPEAKVQLQHLGHFSEDHLASLAMHVGDAVSLCNPQKRQQVQAILEVVTHAIKQVAGAVWENRHTVMQKVVEAGEQIHQWLDALHSSLQAFAEHKDVKHVLQELVQVMAGLRQGSAHSILMATGKLKNLRLRLLKWSGYADLEESEAQVFAEGVSTRMPCMYLDVKYYPFMKNQKRTNWPTVQDCQRHCENTDGCAHFSYWPDGGCHLQDSSASLRRGRHVISGNPTCD